MTSPSSSDGTPRRRPFRAQRPTRALPLVLLAVAAFASGAAVGGDAGGDDTGARYVAAWARGDLGGMHAMLTPAARRRYPLLRFVELHRRAAAQATLVRLRAAGKTAERGGELHVVPVRADTRTFGVLRLTLRLPVVDAGDARAVAWEPHLVFPGLRRRERLRRDVTMPTRADLEARDGTVLATGASRTPEVAPLSAEVVGRVGPIPPDRRREYEAAGYPPDAAVGLTGLERQFERRLAGRFGGMLRAGGRVLARADARAGAPVRTSLDPRIQRAADVALAGRLGGIAVVRPQTGEVLALAGLASAAPQPPGSIFKIITLAGALEAGTVKSRARFPVQTAATLEGVELENANRESCGGSLGNSFAHSCNSVFAPLGARLGARELAAAAQRFGFNEELPVVGAVAPSMPAAEEIGDDLAVGSTAIGQGRLLSTPLHMVGVAGAIANRGEYVRPVLLRGARGRATRATTPGVARIVGRFMRRVVTSGTGVAAQIKGVRVAGKTGTAELRDSTRDPDEEAQPGQPAPPADDRTDTTAWFVAFAPASRPRVAVAVMLVGQGTGGETAAPAAREVIQAALARAG